jgi:hypothetical protein
MLNSAVTAILIAGYNRRRALSAEGVKKVVSGAAVTR